jgi:hypothetical protein
MSVKRKTTISLLAVAAVAVVAGAALTFSAFTSTTENPGNEFTAGTVVLDSNGTGSALFSLLGMQPGSTDTKCLTVTYTGTLDALVRLYATTTSTTTAKDLSPYLDVSVTRGSFPGDPPPDMGCGDFAADPTDFPGAPATAGALFQDTLDKYPVTWALGVQDPTTWKTSDKAVYQVRVALRDNDAAQARDATTRLSFEARDKGVTPAPSPTSTPIP